MSLATSMCSNDLKTKNNLITSFFALPITCMDEGPAWTKDLLRLRKSTIIATEKKGKTQEGKRANFFFFLVCFLFVESSLFPIFIS